MPIDPDFPKNHQTIGKYNHSDGEHYHFVWDQEDQMLKHPQSPGYKKHTRHEEKSIFLLEFMALWCQLAGIRVTQMEPVSKLVVFKYSNSTGQKTTYLLGKWQMR